jgi:mycothiol synthase
MLPDGFTFRAPTLGDAPRILTLLDACDREEYGSPKLDLPMLNVYFGLPTLDLARDAWMVIAPDGALAGFMIAEWIAELAQVDVFGGVHPEYTGHGIATALVAETERRAGEFLPGVPVTIMHPVAAVNAPANALLQKRGYTPARTFWRMEIDMDAPPPTPALPPGMTIRIYLPGVDDYATYETIEEAFEDHWGFVREDYDEWMRRRVHVDNFDPALWFLACEGDEIAGASLCRYRAGNAWVGALGVRRRWRGRGVGLALLQHTFAAFYARGDRNVALGVDAQSPTGATRLYERAGMRVTRHYTFYSKRVGA